MNCSTAALFCSSVRATSTIWSTRSAKKLALGSRPNVDRGDDDHVEAPGLIEGLFDVGFADRPVAPAARRNKRHQVDVGFAVAGDHVGQVRRPMATSTSPASL